MRLITRYGLLPLLLCGLSAPLASAQSPPTNLDGWSVSAGVGALLSPNYMGDDAYSVSAVPYIRATHGDRFFASVQEGAGYNVINQDGFRAGPLLTLSFGRDEDGEGPFRIAGSDTNDLIGLGDIDTSVSLGGFIEKDFAGLTASAKAGQALGGHDGLTGELGLSVKGRVQGNGPPIIYSFGPRLNFGDDQYMNAFFGVDAAQSAASNLAPYQASGGIVSYGVSGTVIMPLTRSVSTTLIGSYTHLSSDAADSPLVSQRGSADQGFIGIVTAYTFN